MMRAAATTLIAAILLGTVPDWEAAADRLPLAPVAAGSPEAPIAEEVLDGLDRMTEENRKDFRLDVAAPVTATRDGDTVRLGFPGVRLEIVDGPALDLGDLALFVITGAEGTRSYRLPLPTRLAIEDLGGPGELEMEAGEVGGTWNGQLAGLTDFALRFDGLALTTRPAPEVVLDLAPSRLALSLSRAAATPGVWSVKLDAEIGAVGVDSDIGFRLALGGLGVHGRVDNLDVPAWETVMDPNDAEPPANPSWGLAELVLSLSGLDLTVPAELDAGRRRERRPENVVIDRLEAMAGFDALAERGIVQASVDIEGLVLAPCERLCRLAPRDIRIDLALSPLPLGRLLGMVSGSPPDSVGGLAGEAFTVLHASDTRLQLRRSGLATAQSRVELDGALGLSAPEDAIPVKGAFRGEISGFGAVLESLAANAQGTSAAELGAPFMVMMLAGFGRPVDTDGGGLRYAYDIEVRPNGVLRINDALVELTHLGKFLFDAAMKANTQRAAR